MAILNTTTKTKLGAKATKAAVKSAGLGARATAPVAKLSLKATTPLAKRRAQRRIDRFTGAVRGAAAELVTYGPQAAQELGLVEAPKSKRTAPRVAAGVVIGASAVYFLEPGHGKEHREKLTSLVG